MLHSEYSLLIMNECIIKKQCFSSFIIYFDLFLSLKRVQFDIFIIGQSSCQFPMHLEKITWELTLVKSSLRAIIISEHYLNGIIDILCLEDIPFVNT